MKLFKALTTLLFLVFVTICAPVSTYAADGGFVPLSNTQGVSGGVSVDNFGQLFGISKTTGDPSADLRTFVENAFKVALSLGAILAILRIAWAGYQYMVSDAWGEKSHAKEILGDVAIGLLILLSAYLILYQINPDILKIQLSVLNSTPAQSAPANSANTGF